MRNIGQTFDLLLYRSVLDVSSFLRALVNFQRDLLQATDSVEELSTKLVLLVVPHEL